MRTGFMPVKAAAVRKGGRPLLFILLSCLLALPLPGHAAEPLAIEWAARLGNCGGFNIRFSEPVNPHTATNIANYQLDAGTIEGIRPLHGTNLQEFVVQVRSFVSDYQVVSVSGVASLGFPPQIVATDTSTRILSSDGFVSAVYFGVANGSAPIPGETLEDLYASPRFPDSPDFGLSSDALESAPGFGSNYGVRLVGRVVPRESGYYYFYLAAGAQAALYLSPTSSSLDRRLIAVEPGGHPFRDYLSKDNRTNTVFGNASFPGIADTAAVNRSTDTVGLIRLEGGLTYFIEGVMKVGAAGADNFSVAWRFASGPEIENGSRPIPGPHLVLHSSSGGCPDATIVFASVPDAFDEGETVSMQAVAGGNSSYPARFQWFLDGAPIRQATNSIFIIEDVPAELVGARFACRVRNNFGEDSTDPLQTAERPSLGFVNEGNQRFLVWPASYWDFTPQSALELDAETEWNDLPGGILSATEFRTPIPTGGEQRFFRAMKLFPASPPQP